MRPKTGGEELSFATGRSSLGAVPVASSARGVVTIYFGEEPGQLLGELQEEFPEAHLFAGDREDRQRVARVLRYLEVPAGTLELPLDLRGTAFQKKVWQAVQAIPVGTVSTYTAIAAQIGAPRAMRAVGSACARNPLALLIPCHRVLRKDGTPAGGAYWGTERRRALMEREAKVRLAGSAQGS